MCEWSESSWTFSRRQQRKQTQHLKWERLLRHSPWHSAGPYVSSAACPPAGSPSYCCHYQDNLQKHETEYHVNLGLLSFFTVCRLQATTHKLDHSSSSSSFSSNLFWLVSDRLLSWRSIHPLSCVRNERSAVNQFTLVAAHQRHDGDEQKQRSRSFYVHRSQRVLFYFDYRVVGSRSFFCLISVLLTRSAAHFTFWITE